MKVTIHTATGSNEQIVAEVELKNPQEWDQKVAPVFPKLEARVGDRARRIIAGNKQMKDLLAKDPVLYNQCHNIILVCLGQMPTVDDTGLVDKSWEAPKEFQLEPVEEAA